MPETNDAKASKLFNNLEDISLLHVVLIIAVAVAIIFASRRIFPFLAEKSPYWLRLYLLSAEPIVRLLVILVSVLLLIPLVFNVTLQNFFVIAGAASVAIGFAFKDYVSSLVAGVVSVVERPYRQGDWVRFKGHYGEVRNAGLRAVTLQTPADDTVTLPHSAIWTEPIANSNDGSRTLMCVADFFLHPEHSVEKVRAELQDVALTSAYLDYKKPIIVVLKETVWGTHYRLKAYPFDMRNQFLFISDLTSRAKVAFGELGVTEVCAPAAKAPDGDF